MSKDFRLTRSWRVLAPLLCCEGARRPSATAEDHEVRPIDTSPSPPDIAFPVYPPPPPRQILDDRDSYRQTTRKRVYAAPRGEWDDTSLYVLYRLYESTLLDDNIGMRNDLEYFWWQKWPVEDIPDPLERGEPERYAVLACIPFLLAESFNHRIDLGLRREGKPIMHVEDRLQLAATPKKYETVPAWTKHAAPVAKMLHIPHAIDNESQLDSLEDPRASLAFKAKNILLWQPHIHFV